MVSDDHQGTHYTGSIRFVKGDLRGGEGCVEGSEAPHNPISCRSWQ